MSSGSSNHKPNDRFRRAKSEITHNRISTQTLRTEFRARFFNRLRDTRSKSVDRFRQIVEDYGDTIECVSDIRRLLLQDQNGASLLQSEELNEFLNLIEHELEHIHINNETDMYVNNIKRETEDAVNRLLDVCRGCGKPCGEDICSQCASMFTYEFK